MDTKKIVESVWNAGDIKSDTCSNELLQAVTEVLDALNVGKLRVAEKINGSWVVNEWVKKSILLAFRVFPVKLFNNNPACFYDRIALKYAGYEVADFQRDMVRVVPNALVRYGCYIGANVLLMPSYVNIGSYIGSCTMVDMFASIGSCAQIGSKVHIASGVSIGGVLEPVNASPVIIEDNVFIGSNSSITEGVIVEENSVIGSGVNITASTAIYDRANGSVSYGLIPAGSVVVAGSLKKSEEYSLHCAVIIKKVDDATRSKVAINDLLRF